MKHRVAAQKGCELYSRKTESGIHEQLSKLYVGGSGSSSTMVSLSKPGIMKHEVQAL
jgi:hypothetical protein